MKLFQTFYTIITEITIKQIITMMDALKNIYIVNISILSSITLSNETHIFLKEAHVKEEIRDLNKNSSRGHDKMTTELRIQ